MSWTAPRILVIAAQPALCFTIEELLRAYGYDVTIVPRSAAALHLDAEGHFAAMLLDPTCLTMPALAQSPPIQFKSHDELEAWSIEDCIPI